MPVNFTCSCAVIIISNRCENRDLELAQDRYEFQNTDYVEVTKGSINILVGQLCYYSLQKLQEIIKEKHFMDDKLSNRQCGGEPQQSPMWRRTTGKEMQERVTTDYRCTALSRAIIHRPLCFVHRVTKTHTHPNNRPASPEFEVCFQLQEIFFKSA